MRLLSGLTFLPLSPSLSLSISLFFFFFFCLRAVVVYLCGVITLSAKITLFRDEIAKLIFCK